MNIVFVSLRSTVSYLGGAEILTQVIAESLVRRGHTVTIYTAGANGRSLVHGVQIQETPLLSFPMRFRTALMPLYALCLGPIFKAKKDFQNADIIHAIDSDAIMLMSAWKFLYERFVVTIQDYTLIWPTKDFFAESIESKPTYSVINAMATWLRKRIKTRAVQRLRYAVCVSAFVAREVQKVNSRITLSIIGNCISPLWQKRTAPKKRDIDILYVGKLMPYKGVDILLGSLALLLHRGAYRIVIVGEGLEKRYAKIASELGIAHQIIFTGPLSYAHMPTYYLRSKVVVSPSIWPEPCGRSIIEAMWMGCAVVATNVGGTPESLIDGQHGYLVPPSVPDAIARASRALLTHAKIRERFGKQAAEYAHMHYSSQRIAKEYDTFYALIKSK